MQATVFCGLDAAVAGKAFGLTAVSSLHRLTLPLSGLYGVKYGLTLAVNRSTKEIGVFGQGLATGLVNTGISALYLDGRLANQVLEQKPQGVPVGV